MKKYIGTIVFVLCLISAFILGHREWSALVGSSVPTPVGSSEPESSDSSMFLSMGSSAPVPVGSSAPVPVGSSAPVPVGSSAPVPAGSSAPTLLGSSAPESAGSSEPMLQSAPPPTLIGKGQTSSARIAVALAGPQTYLAPVPTAFVVLKDPKDQYRQVKRNQDFCRAFMKIPTVAQISSQSVITPPIIATHWLLDTDQISISDASNCSFLLSHYDYERAGQLMASISLSSQHSIGKTAPVNWNDNGPFLVEIFPGGTMIIVDISGIDTDQNGSDQSFSTFLSGWQKKFIAKQEKFLAGVAESQNTAESQAGSDASAAASGPGLASDNNVSGILKNIVPVAIKLAEFIPYIGPYVRVASVTIDTVCAYTQD